MSAHNVPVVIKALPDAVVIGFDSCMACGVFLYRMFMMTHVIPARLHSGTTVFKLALLTESTAQGIYFTQQM